MTDPVIGFRPLTYADIDDVVRWQQAPHASRWFAGRGGPDDLRTRYGPRIEGEDPTRMWVVEVNGRSVGYVQDYRIGDHPEYAIRTGSPDAVGLDYLIGEPSLVGRGLGTEVLGRYLREVVVSHYPDTTTLHAAPDHRNAVSLRVLEKLGFEQGLWFDDPQPGGEVTTMIACTLDVGRLLC